MAEQIIKDTCPKCEAVNYVNNGDVEDPSGVDIEGIQCHACGYEWVWDMDEVWLDIIGGVENANIEKGKPTI